MPALPRPWTVLRHGPVVQHEENLFSVVGVIPEMPMPLARRMVVVRRRDGTLLVHNAVALDEAAMRTIEALGEPRTLIVPNAWHRLDAHAFKQRYPRMRVLCPARAIERVRELVEVSGDYDALSPDEAVRVEAVEGGTWGEGVFLVESERGVTLVFNDTFMNQPHMPGFYGFGYRLLGASGSPRVHPFCKWTAKKKPLRAHLERLATTKGLVRIIPGHGELIDEDAAAVLARAAAAV